MMRSIISIGLLSIITIFSYACRETEKSDRSEINIAKKSQVEKQAVRVLIDAVQENIFTQELHSNGQLSAREKAVIPFIVQEQVIELSVHNGQRVKKGQVLARLDPFEYKKKLVDSEHLYDKARIDLEDQLLGLGYLIGDSALVPANTMNMAKIRSGYYQAWSNLSQAKRNYEHTIVKAPFNGVVSNLEAKALNPSSAYEKCCEVINDAIMVVKFSVLEKEMALVKRGLKIELLPFALPNQHFKGHIQSINPSIDEHGMIAITAEVNNPDGLLMDGMNVKVIVKNEIANSIIIPKSAVLYRQNRKVVFVHEDGLAKWVYVEVGKENSTHVTITDGSLKPGQEVIISNNLNLAHETAVSVVSNQ